MENKYFTPNIEDLRLNYECELNIDHYKNESDWIEFTIFDSQDLSTFIKDVNQLRVPYLTKEQIEAEGWKPANTGGLERGCMNGRCAFTKGNYFLIIPSEPNTKLGDRIEIVMADVLKDEYHEWTSNGRMYIGQCKDINTFRYICKLINIK